jgi:hypothetical protein
MWFVRSGARVTGPFSEDELRVKRRLGEFAPTHQISTDRVRWESAAPLVQMIDGSQPVVLTRANPGGPAAQGGRDSAPAGNAPPAPKAVWYYLDANRQQVGPVPEPTLLDLLGGGHLSGNTLACKLGENRWDRARNHPDLAPFVAPRSHLALIALAVSAAVIVFIVVVALLFQAMFGSKAAPASDSDPTAIKSAARGRLDHRSGDPHDGPAENSTDIPHVRRFT